MLVAVLLAPASRYGYLVYSIGLLLLPVLAGSAAVEARAAAPAGMRAPGMRSPGEYAQLTAGAADPAG